MFAGYRLRMALSMMVVLAGGSLTACHKNEADKAKPVVVKKTPAEMKALTDSAKQSLDGLSPLIAEKNAKFATLRPQVEALPPDLENFGPTRGKFFGAQEALGRLNSEVAWLQGRMDAAVKANDGGEMDDISKSIARAYDDLPEFDQVYMELVHEVPAFERQAAQVKAQEKAACETKAAAAVPAALLMSKKPATK